MKLSRFLLGTLACTMLAACSNEDKTAIDSGQGEGQLSYVAINIVNANATGSRVDGATYENGEGDENVISTARFYLFDADGNAYTIANSASGASAGTNIVEITSLGDATPNSNKPNVEKIKKGVLVFRGTTSELPTSIVAVLNPPSSLDKTSKSLTKLQDAIADYGSTSSGTFVMSNSVYESGGNKVVATNIVGKVAASEADAIANPVDIYVERTVAKVEATFTGTETATTDGEIKYKVTEESVTPAVYAKVLGWAVTTDNRTSNLLKDIDPTWDNTTIGFTWNDEPYYRSYWAETPSSITPTNDKSAQEIQSETGAVRYCQENTKSPYTNLIVVARLVNESGDPQAYYKYYGVACGSENEILTLIANKYNNVYFTKTSGSGADVYNSIKPENLKIVAKTTLGTIKDYEVVAVLNTSETIYMPDGAGYKEVTADAVNAELAKNPAQIAKDGLVYYYTPIKHLGGKDKTGEYGVVRNHIYKIGVSDITGFGTPIYDPDKDIIPTTPEDAETYIAARINILSWRVVNQTGVVLGQ